MANLSEPFIRRPVMTTLVMFAVAFFGVLSYFSLPVASLPDVAYPTIVVYGSWSGADPDTMANNVATPLEKQLMTIEGMDVMNSTNNTGSTIIICQFDIDKTMDEAALDVSSMIAKAMPFLPPDMDTAPTYSKVNPNVDPIMYFALTSETLPIPIVYNYGFTLFAQRANMVEGVSKVPVYGDPYAVRVQVDPMRLLSKGIDLAAVANAVANSNPSLPTGEFDGDYITQMILADGQMLEARDYNQVIVDYLDGQPVRIGDLGQAIPSQSNNRYSLKYITKDKSLDCVSVNIQTEPDANALDVAKAIGDFIPQVENELPNSIDLTTTYDYAPYIVQSVEEVEETLLVAFVLVVLVIFLFLGEIRDTVIPAVVLPLAILGTFGIMYVVGFSLDTLSLLAITLAIGFIIDDAIVVLENIVRYGEEGLSPFEAALKGSQQISFTVLSMSLSLAAVFIPLVFMGGLVGKMLHEFSLTIVIVVLMSGFISLTLTPMLCSRFIPQREPIPEEERDGAFMKWMKNSYRSSLSFALKVPYLIVLLGGGCVYLTYLAGSTLPTDFMPGNDLGQISAATRASEGVSPYQMMDLQANVEEVVRNNPHVEGFISGAAIPNINGGILFLTLIPYDDRPFINDVAEELREACMNIPGVNTYFKPRPLLNLSFGGSTSAYQYSLRGMDDEEVYTAAAKMTDAMREIPGLIGVNNDLYNHSPVINVKIERDRAGALGITAQDVENALRLGLAESRVSLINGETDQYDVKVLVLPEDQKDATTLEKIYIRSSMTGEVVPFSSVATWEMGVGMFQVNHIDQLPSVTISFNLAQGAALGDAIAQVNALAEQYVTPGVTPEWQGTAKEMRESFASMRFLLFIALVVMYIILGILYESFIHPITIFSSLPAAGLGAFLTLHIFNEVLSLYAFVGVIMLIGIVQKNSIMMVDQALHNEEFEGMEPLTAIVEAALTRFRPILMTTLAAIMGAVPVAIGFGQQGASRRPMGLAIVGGLCFSQLLTFFLTPVVYYLLSRVSHKTLHSLGKE